MTDRLEVGKTYVARGPAEGSKLGPPQQVEIVGIDEDAGRYQTKGARQVAPVIVFGAEDFWRPLLPAELETAAREAKGPPSTEQAGPGPVPSQEGVRPAPLSQGSAWWQGRMVGFDLETTSPEPEEARIVTAAIAFCGGGQETSTFTWLVNPGIEIPDEAAEIHGITTERARAEGDDAGAAITEILEVLSDMTPEGAPLVIFNARYDLTVLDREARRHGLNPLGTGRPYRVVDPLVIDKWLDRYRPTKANGSRKLEGMCRHYGAKLDEAHDAAFDAIAAARLAWCLGKRGRVIRRVRNGGDALELKALEQEWERVRQDLDLLHGAQQRWAGEERERFAEYKRSIGEHDLAVKIAGEIGWPVLELAPEREAIAA